MCESERERERERCVRESVCEGKGCVCVEILKTCVAQIFFLIRIFSSFLLFNIPCRGTLDLTFTVLYDLNLLHCTAVSLPQIDVACVTSDRRTSHLRKVPA